MSLLSILTRLSFILFLLFIPSSNSSSSSIVVVVVLLTDIISWSCPNFVSSYFSCSYLVIVVKVMDIIILSHSNYFYIKLSLLSILTRLYFIFFLHLVVLAVVTDIITLSYFRNNSHYYQFWLVYLASYFSCLYLVVVVVTGIISWSCPKFLDIALSLL